MRWQTTCAPIFLERLAERAVRIAPPMGFFKSFVVEKGGAHNNELNLRDKGISPLLDCVRLFALERGIRETSTIERIEALRTDHPIVQEYADEIENAFEFLMLLRIHHRYERLTEGKAPDNFIDPNRLSHLEKRSLKDAFQLIAKVQDLIIERYQSVAW
jgi:CBS domain-containing protein